MVISRNMCHLLSFFIVLYTQISGIVHFVILITVTK